MASPIHPLADALKDWLNAARDPAWSQTFTAVRLWRAKWTLVELDTLRVAVVPGPVTWHSMDRSHELRRIALDILFGKKVAPNTNSAVDAIVDLMDEVATALGGVNLTAGSKQFKCASRKDPSEPSRQFVDPEQMAIDEHTLSHSNAFLYGIRTTWTQLTP